MRTDNHLQSFFRPWVVLSGGVAEEIGKGLSIRDRTGLQNKEAKESCVIAMLTDLYYRHSIAVSLNRNHYGKYSKVFIPRWFTLANVEFAVKELENAGLVRVLDGSYDIHESTTLIITPLLLSLFEVGEQPITKDKALVQLRDSKGNAMKLPKNQFTRGRERDLEELNQFTSTQIISYNPYTSLQSLINIHPLNNTSPLYKTDSHKSTGTIGQREYFRPLNQSVHSVFNVDLKHGGRIYTSAGAQNTRRDERKTLIINGDATVEPDYSAMHLRMLYASVGIQYDADGYLVVSDHLGSLELRPLVKLCFNTAINASVSTYSGGVYKRLRELKHSIDAGKRAESRLMWDLMEEHDVDPDKILKAIRYIHQPIAHFITAKVGAELQLLDGKISLDTMLQLKERGIVSCGVHDSIIVPDKYKETAIDVMHESYSKYMGGFNAVID